MHDLCVYVFMQPLHQAKPCVRGVPNSPLLFTILFPLLPQLPYILSRSSPPRLDHHAACSSLDTFLRSARFLQLLTSEFAGFHLTHLCLLHISSSSRFACCQRTWGNLLTSSHLILGCVQHSNEYQSDTCWGD